MASKISSLLLLSSSSATSRTISEGSALLAIDVSLLMTFSGSEPPSTTSAFSRVISETSSVLLFSSLLAASSAMVPMEVFDFFPCSSAKSRSAPTTSTTVTGSVCNAARIFG